MAPTLDRVAEAEAWAGFDLHTSGRYQHSEAYLRRVLAQAGMEIASLETVTLRLEGGQPVIGFLVTARRSPEI